MSKEDQPNPITETRNSWIREKTKGTFEGLAEEIHNHFPFISPTHVNIAGVIGVKFASEWAKKINTENTDIALKQKLTRQLLVAAALGITNLFDAVDGPLARLKNKLNPGSIDFDLGDKLDASVDRIEEYIMGANRIKTAKKNGHKVDELAAFTATITNPFPSVFRAKSEAKGVIVPEGGKSLLGFFGTRVGRAITSIAAAACPEIKIKGIRIPIQTPLDIATTISNVKTIVERFNYSQQPDNIPPELSPEKLKKLTKEESEKRKSHLEIIKKARSREGVLVTLAGATVVAALIAYSRHKKN